MPITREMWWQSTAVVLAKMHMLSYTDANAKVYLLRLSRWLPVLALLMTVMFSTHKSCPRSHKLAAHGKLATTVLFSVFKLCVDNYLTAFEFHVCNINN